MECGGSEEEKKAAQALPEALVAPLADYPELQFSMLANLREGISRAKLKRGDDGPVVALAKARAPRGERWRKSLLGWIAALGVFTAWLVAMWQEVPGYLYFNRLYDGFDIHSEFFSGYLRPHMENACRDLQVDPSLFNSNRRQRRDEYYRLWQKQPEEGWRYGVYGHYCKRLGVGLDRDYDATWQRLDPDNALWPLLAIDEDLTSWNFDKDPLPVGVPNALRRLEEAASMPRLETYREECRRGIEAESLTPECRSAALMIRREIGFSEIELNPPIDLIYHYCQRLVARGNHEELKAFIPTARKVVMLLADLESGRADYGRGISLDGLIKELSAYASSENLKDEEVKLGEMAVARSLIDYYRRSSEFDRIASRAESPVNFSAWPMEARLVLLNVAGGCLALAALMQLRGLPPRGAGALRVRCLEPLVTPRQIGVQVVLVAIPALVWNMGWLVFTPDVEMPYRASTFLSWVVLAAVWACVVIACRRHIARCTAVVGMPRAGWGVCLVAAGALLLPVMLVRPPIEVYSVVSWDDVGLQGIGTVALALIGLSLYSLRRWDLDLQERLVMKSVIPTLVATAALLIAITPGLRSMEKQLLSTPGVIATSFETYPNLRACRVALQELQKKWDAE